MSRIAACFGAMALASATWAFPFGAAPPQDDGREGRGFEVQPGDPGPAERARPFGTPHALLIAVADYAHFPKLKTPKSDIARLERVLRAQYGFERIETLVDARATRTGILTALERYKRLTKEDNLLIYYAGHGTFDKETREGYWIPVEAGESRWDWIANDQIRKVIGQIPARHTLLVSDSCFSGDLTRGVPVEKTARTDRYIEQVAKKDSYQVIASGGLEEVGDVGRDGLSAFAYYFVNSLCDDSKPVLTTREVFDSVVRMVANDSRQVPEMGTIQGAPDLKGEFIFARVRADGSAAAPLGPLAPATGVPAGWSLPAGAEERRRADGSFAYVSVGPDETEMVLVLPGEFPFGGSGSPLVALDRPYLVDLHEVTVERFAKFLPTEPQADLPYWNREGYGAPHQPVVGVSFATAQAFARWARKQLPDEVLWEYAAAWDAERGELRTFPWGREFDAQAVPVALFPPQVGSAAVDVSPWGVRGMGSGVQEWCLLPAGHARRLEPIGVVRGASQVGSGRRHRVDAPVTTRVERSADTRASSIGFRCVLPLQR
jgi:hypothetical protein